MNNNFSFKEVDCIERLKDVPNKERYDVIYTILTGKDNLFYAFTNGKCQKNDGYKSFNKCMRHEVVGDILTTDEKKIDEMISLKRCYVEFRNNKCKSVEKISADFLRRYIYKPLLQYYKEESIYEDVCDTLDEWNQEKFYLANQMRINPHEIVIDDTHQATVQIIGEQSLEMDEGVFPQRIINGIPLRAYPCVTAIDDDSYATVAVLDYLQALHDYTVIVDRACSSAFIPTTVELVTYDIEKKKRNIKRA